MATLNIRGFGGMRPIAASRLLPDFMAEDTANAYMESGSLRPLPAPEITYTFEGQDVPKAARLAFRDGTYSWVPLTNIGSDIVKAPITNDAFDRFYKLDPPGTPLRFNTKARILAGSPWYLLGLPAPANTPTITVTGGSGSITETRAYVFTYIDEFGQEGPPSPPVVASGLNNATWTVGNLNTTVPSSSERPTVSKKIYRTVVSASGVGTYFFVATVSLATSSYADTRLGSEIALGPTLETTSSYAPPAALDGIVSMPGGFLVGWQGRDLYFSQPYKPWAWPAEFDFTLEYNAIGCGVFGQTLVVATAGVPYAATGNTPASVTPQKLAGFFPCASKQSVVSGQQGVYYTSANGLISVAGSGATNLTTSLVERTDWSARYANGVIGAAVYGTNIFALQDNTQGWLISVAEERLAFRRLQGFTGIDTVWNDPFSGDVLMTRSSAAGTDVLRWNTAGNSPQAYAWRSKEFYLPQPQNFGVLLVQGEGAPIGLSPQGATSETSPPPTGAPMSPDLSANTADTATPAQKHARIGKTSVIGYTGIGATGAYLNETPGAGTLPTGLEGNEFFSPWPYWPAMNGDLGYDPDGVLVIPPGSVGVVRVYANRVIVYQEALRVNAPVALPSGFRADIWQVQVTANVTIHSIQLATTQRELQSV